MKIKKRDLITLNWILQMAPTEAEKTRRMRARRRSRARRSFMEGGREGEGEVVVWGCSNRSGRQRMENRKSV